MNRNTFRLISIFFITIFSSSKSSNYQYDILNSKKYDFIKCWVKKEQLSPCDILDYLVLARLDSSTFEYTYVLNESLRFQSIAISLLDSITGIEPRYSGTFTGPTYLKDTTFYGDLYRWAKGLNCQQFTNMDRNTFLRYMDSLDLSHDSVYFSSLLKKHNIKRKKPYPPEEDFRIFEWPGIR